METDRELLELAAKAVGLIIIDPDLLVDGKFMVRHISDGRLDRWNARDDDGDALRLANALHINIEYVRSPGRVHFVEVCAYPSGRGDCIAFEPIRNDADAATRRAIVRAARMTML